MVGAICHFGRVSLRQWQEVFCPLNFTIEMETGTGRTYSFIKTMYELNKVYGFKKFVVVVPSVAATRRHHEEPADHPQPLCSGLCQCTLRADFDDSTKLTDATLRRACVERAGHQH